MWRALLFLLAVSGWAQLPVDIHPVTGHASDRLKEAERRFEAIRQMVWREPQAPEEKAILERDAEFYRRYFQPPIEAPQIAITQENGEDILVARWSSSLPELYSWDVPGDSDHIPGEVNFLFRPPPHAWVDEAAVRSSFQSLTLPPASDYGSAKSVRLNFARDPYRKEWIGAGDLLIAYTPRQFDNYRSERNWFDFWDTASASFIAFAFRPAPMSPTVPDIPERFPPLASRLSQWTTQHLLTELRLQTSWPRDTILAEELLRRDITNDELFALQDARWTHHSRDNGGVLQDIVQAHQVLRFAQTLSKYLERDITATVMSIGPHPFWVLESNYDCNFASVALQVLQRAPSADAAFSYVASHGETADDYKQLAKVPLPPYKRPEVDLARMRKRLNLDDAGNPLPGK